MTAHHASAGEAGPVAAPVERARALRVAAGLDESLTASALLAPVRNILVGTLRVPCQATIALSPNDISALPMNGTSRAAEYMAAPTCNSATQSRSSATNTSAMTKNEKSRFDDSTKNWAVSVSNH